MTADLAIAYRVYPGISKSPMVFSDNKLELTRFGLESLQNALLGVRVSMLAILDGCPDSYAHMVSELFPGPDTTIIRAEKEGNFATFGMQGKWLLEQDAAEAVFFAEDDYYYRANSFAQMLDFLDSGDDIDFVTPYEHPDLYRGRMNTFKRERRSHQGQEWQKVSSTCLTFLTTRTTLRRTWPQLSAYCRGVSDSTIWTALTRFPPHRTRAGKFLKSMRYLPRQALMGPSYHLWSPTPGFATHLESKHIAPGFEAEILEASVGQSIQPIDAEPAAFVT